MEIRKAILSDIDWLAAHDHHVSAAMLTKKIHDGEIYVVAERENIGWLRYGLFWDSIPFMNLLFLLEGYRNQGIGKKLVEYWERDMVQQGYKIVFTSTQANEFAQHFYRKLGYTDIGGFIVPQEVMEIMLMKNIAP
ncbi:acetyltransferase, GNAT family [Candidatus Moduliflexus flocculans]|uniref:Acetyltransferase, GNAT family n=1 Tax=Candidatus Moduliflexus flocculans TaxID=1499966 RepID=A0A081BSQ2_9BACT|nr:acetyltransferase, GNAT family [Candidatus Moduliflexus flocculans]